jgi:hypothetical protein
MATETVSISVDLFYDTVPFEKDLILCAPHLQFFTRFMSNSIPNLLFFKDFCPFSARKSLFFPFLASAAFRNLVSLSPCLIQLLSRSLDCDGAKLALAIRVDGVPVFTAQRSGCFVGE